MALFKTECGRHRSFHRHCHIPSFLAVSVYIRVTFNGNILKVREQPPWLMEQAMTLSYDDGE